MPEFVVQFSFRKEALLECGTQSLKTFELVHAALAEGERRRFPRKFT